MLRLLTLLSALFFASAGAATTLWVDAPRDEFLNLRTGPSTQYHVIDRMPHGSTVKLLRAPGKWVKVRHESGKVGWAHSRFLSDHKVRTRHHRDRDGFGRRPNGQDLWVHAPGFGGLNLRHGPGTQYPVIMTMRQRDRAHELGRQGKWILLRHESGKVGWAHGDYLVTRDPGYGRQPDRKRGGHADPDRGKWDKDRFKRGHKKDRRADDLADALRQCFGKPAARFDRCVDRVLRRKLGHRNR